MIENQDIRIRLKAYDCKLLDNSAAEEEFEEAGIQVKLKPIPAGILNVYEMLLK